MGIVCTAYLPPGENQLTIVTGEAYVHHRWELFSRDTTHQVYLAPEAAGTLLNAKGVQRTARHVLPAAPARYEALPVILTEGAMARQRLQYRPKGN
jgi:hypothetical protein